MARAFACDRCGDLFKNEDREDKVRVVLENGNPYSMFFGDESGYLTICPKCRASFQKWWDTNAVRKTTDPDCPPIVHTLYQANEEYESEVDEDIIETMVNFNGKEVKKRR